MGEARKIEKVTVGQGDVEGREIRLGRSHRSVRFGPKYPVAETVAGQH
jgi:hypothetical protein